VARMGLQAAVTIVDGQLASLDTANKLVGLDDGSQLPYDLLVVATGLQVCSRCCGSLLSGQCCPRSRGRKYSIVFYMLQLARLRLVCRVQNGQLSCACFSIRS
jgi:hypothetical protein